MKVMVTAREIKDKGIWNDFCEDKGMDPWSISEGIIDSDEEFTLSEKEAKKYGFIKES